VKAGKNAKKESNKKSLSGRGEKRKTEGGGDKPAKKRRL
jgi:hypothetical protein